MKLRIKETSWSGWTKDYKPEEIEKEYDLHLNEKYIIKTREVTRSEKGKLVKKEEEIFSFDIIEINESSIKIKTYQNFLSNEDTDMPNGKNEFYISNEKSLNLATPTRDYKDIFVLMLVD